MIENTLNIETYSLFEGVSSYHIIVSAKICLRLSINKKHLYDKISLQLSTVHVCKEFTAKVIKKSLLEFRIYVKGLYLMTNEKTFSPITCKQQLSAYKKRTNKE